MYTIPFLSLSFPIKSGMTNTRTSMAANASKIKVTSNAGGFYFRLSYEAFSTRSTYVPVSVLIRTMSPVLIMR